MKKIKISTFVRSGLGFILLTASLLSASILLQPRSSSAEPSTDPAVICTQSGGVWESNDRAGGYTCDQCKAGTTTDGFSCVPVSTTPSNGSGATSTDPANAFGETASTGDQPGKYTCGKGAGNTVNVAFNFGCIGDKYSGNALNPIVDIAFAIFRFLSAGVGLVVIGSIVVAGIQYSASRGEPQATGAAIHRITNSLIALLIYIFMFAIANFLVPGGMFL